MKWVLWQLADDEATYGMDAGAYIIVSEDGEVELIDGLTYGSEAAAAEDLAKVNADTCRYCGGGGLHEEGAGCYTCLKRRSYFGTHREVTL